MNRRGFLGGMLAALAAPAIIRTPGLLMPVSIFALPVYGPGGVLTDDMIAAECNRRLQRLVPAAVNRGVEQTGISFTVPHSHFRLSVDAFAERHLDPVVHHLAQVIGPGALSVGMQMSCPWGVDVATNNRNGVFARLLRARDFYPGVPSGHHQLRLDVMHT